MDSLSTSRKHSPTKDRPTPLELLQSGGGHPIALAIVLFAVVTVWRFADTDPRSAIGFLYVVPIALLAVTRGIKGACAGVGLAMLFQVGWVETIDEISLTPGQYAVRLVAFASVGIIVGSQVDRGRRFEREAMRWFEISKDPACVASFDGYFTRVNDAWGELLGYSDQELLATPFIDFVHPDDVERTASEAAGLLAGDGSSADFENRYRASDGSWHWLLWSSRSDGHQIYASARDITDRKLLEERLVALANADQLTGLGNRRAWNDRLRAELVHAERTGAPLCMAMIDFDRLKQLNDSEGHLAGDALLREAAHGWLDAVRERDLVVRLGGDEFGVLLPHCDEQEAQIVVQRMRDAMPSGHTFSAGIACWDGTEPTVETMARADAALYAVKQDSRGHTRVAQAAPAASRAAA